MAFSSKRYPSTGTRKNVKKSIYARQIAISIIPIICIDLLIWWSVQQIVTRIYVLIDGSSFIKKGHRQFLDIGQQKLPPTIQEYVDWHARMYSCLSYKNCSEEPKILIWRCPFDLSNKCSGLGDRFRGIQFSVLLAILTKRVFFIEWPGEPYPFTDVVQPSVINWKVPRGINYKNWGVVAHYRWPDLNWLSCPSEIKCSSFSTFQSKAFGVVTDATNMEKADLMGIFSEIPNLSIYTTATGDSTNKLFNNNYLVESKQDIIPSTVGIMNLYKVLLKILFRPSSGVWQKMKGYGLLRGIYSHYMAIHLRTGTDIGEQKLPRFRSFPNEELLVKQLFECLDKFSDSESLHLPIFLASDSATFKKKFMKEGRKRSIPVISNFISPIHISKLGKRERAPGAESWKKFINLYVEFFGIANAVRIIGNRSGFSKMAYYTGNAKHYIRFTPSNISKTGDTWDCHLI